MAHMAKKTSPKKPPPPADDLENDVPTRKDIETVAAFKKLSKGGKIEPSTRDIADALGISQTAAQWRLRHCHRKGLLHRPVVQVLGAYELTEEGEKWLAMAG